MAMNRIFLLGCLTLSAMGLVTHSVKAVADIVVTEQTKVVSDVIVQPVNKKSQHKRKSVIITPPIRIEPDELYKPLDLSVPFTDQDSLDSLKEQSLGQTPALNLFDNKTKKPSRPLELKGGFLMSPEPEMEKKKTVDGAGISINVKPD